MVVAVVVAVVVVVVVVVVVEGPDVREDTLCGVMRRHLQVHHRKIIKREIRHWCRCVTVRCRGVVVREHLLQLRHKFEELTRNVSRSCHRHEDGV